ncbi:MAG: Riboflavin synthase [Dehalococcoidia bacterium]|nr:Riboflavin synthase [Chloroflexota bacterium]
MTAPRLRGDKPALATGQGLSGFQWENPPDDLDAMFTGIVEELGRIRAVGKGQLTVAAQKALDGTEPGDSIAVNGACLTVIAVGDGTFSVEVMTETLRRTNLGNLHLGETVNLERALAVGGRLGGHFVQGHVDGTGRILSMTPEGESVLMKISASLEVMHYLVEKGFIAVDGVSLTIIERDATSFSVSLVTFTRQNTTLGGKRLGDPVNLEVDIIAKYVERLASRDRPEITPAFLAEHGFM